MYGTYRLAELNIGIDSVHGLVHTLCADYLTKENCELTVRTTISDIDFERAKSVRENEREGLLAPNHSDAYYETLAVYRKIAERMPFFDTVLFHGSCVAVDDVAYLFTAKSGTGKSTHTRLWRELFGERAVMVNDDKPLIHVGGEGATVYGTPWDGKHRLSSNIAVPLRAICILGRADVNSIRPITAKEGYPMLLQQVYRPMDPEAMAKTLTLVDLLASSVDLYRLGCNMNPDAAKLAYETMRA